MSNTVYKTFKLHEDQKEIVEGALGLAKQKSGTAVDTVALELICQQFMGTGIMYPTLKSALNAEFKKSGSANEFVLNVAGLVSEISGKTYTLTESE